LYGDELKVALRNHNAHKSPRSEKDKIHDLHILEISKLSGYTVRGPQERLNEDNLVVSLTNVDVDKVEALLPNVINLRGLLHIIAFNHVIDTEKAIHIVQSLLAKGCILNQENYLGRTPLDEAISVYIMRDEDPEQNKFVLHLRKIGAKEGKELLRLGNDILAANAMPIAFINVFGSLESCVQSIDQYLNKSESGVWKKYLALSKLVNQGKARSVWYPAFIHLREEISAGRGLRPEALKYNAQKNMHELLEIIEHSK